MINIKIILSKKQILLEFMITVGPVCQICLICFGNMTKRICNSEVFPENICDNEVKSKLKPC